MFNETENSQKSEGIPEFKKFRIDSGLMKNEWIQESGSIAALVPNQFPFQFHQFAVVDSFWIRQIKQMEFKSQPAHNSTTKFELKKIDAAANS